MSLNVSHPGPEDRLRAYRSRLKDETLPAVIIDCATATVLAANAGGLHALGLTPADRLPATLDSAMPAVSALRDLFHRGLAKPVLCTLVIWRHGRTAMKRCEISAADPDSVSHAAIVFRPDDDATDRLPPADGSPLKPVTLNGPTAANDDSPARIIRDDNETMKEIARRIREGQRTLAAQSPIFEAPELKAPILETSEIEAGTLAVPQAQTVTQFDAVQPSIDNPPDGIGPDIPDIETTIPHTSSWDRPNPPAPVAPAAAAAPKSPATRKIPVDDIAKLAHELKTPLSAIAAASEIMRDERLGAMGNEKYLGYAADIHDSAKHALDVIARMLAAASADDEPHRGPVAFDLTALAARTISALQPLATQRGLTLSLDGEPNLMPVRASATAIRQILLNLLTNALKFTPRGGEVRAATGYLDDGAVYLVVRDTGDGMSSEALDHVFDDGRENMRVRPGGGRGIGLQLVRRLAAENGAEFEIDTAPGKGTVVLLAFAKDLVGGH
ncbi:MAG: HAMP domain-containing histidine kinase [Hyphomicrobium sp.]|nr:HAMP domain-containing histidine kinase [Hyphomicrobium sp.]